MGDWDYVCALCAAPFSAASFQEDPDDDDGIDRSLLPDAAVEWLSHLCVVTENEAALGVGRCYISGPGSDSMYGSVRVAPGEHPNAPASEDGELVLSVYYNYADEAMGGIPMHTKCLDILERVLKRLGHDLNADTLHASLMEAHTDESMCYLGFDYYDFDGLTDQYFQLEAGQEAFVCDPVSIGQLDDYLKHLPTLESCDVVPSKRTAATPQGNDPFSALPAELLTSILLFVSQESIIPFLLASPAARRLELTNSFFLSRIAVDMPWAWEILQPPLCQRTDVDWRAVYTHLHCESGPNRTNALPGLANRRRIWDVCGQAAAIYQRRAQEEERAASQVLVPESVKARAVCTHVLHVLSPTPSKAASLTVWLPVTQATIAGEKTIKLYWTAQGVLSCVIIMIGGEQVLFGTAQGPNVDECAVAKGDWIDGFELGIGASGEGLAVKGVLVRRLVEEPLAFGDMSGHRQLMVVQEGHTLIGLRGAAFDGVISRLGLLELPELLGPPRRPAPDSSVCELMWASEVPDIDISCHPSEFGYWSVAEALDMVVFYPLYFGKSEEQLARLSGIAVADNMLSIMLYHDGKVSSSVGATKDVTFKYVPIDGKGGERIVGFSVCTGPLVAGFKLATNRGRQLVFAQGVHSHDMVTPSAADSFILAGLYCSYGYKGRGPNPPSSVSVLKAPGTSASADFTAFARDACIWEPAPPPSSWHPGAPTFGVTFDDAHTVFLDFSRPVSEIRGLLGAPDWLDVIELGGFVIRYADGEKVYVGIPSPIWSRLEEHTGRELSDLPRHQYMSTSLGAMKPPELPAHTRDDEEVRKQNAGGGIWRLGGTDARIVRTVVWETGGRVDGLQFYSDTGETSLRWGKCGSEPTGEIEAADSMKGVCFALSSRRGPYHTNDPVPMGVRALVA
ncbi:hypothetical protein HDZ31DRAFT_60459 [Schizophyllum fasciatum]